MQSKTLKCATFTHAKLQIVFDGVVLLLDFNWEYKLLYEPLLPKNI